MGSQGLLISFLLTTEAQRAQSGVSFLPDRETTIGQKSAALRARQLQLKATSGNGSWTEVPLGEGDGMFPWPSSPGQGNSIILYVLCVSVVNPPAAPAHNIQIRRKRYKHLDLFCRKVLLELKLKMKVFHLEVKKLLLYKKRPKKGINTQGKSRYEEIQNLKRCSRSITGRIS